MKFRDVQLLNSGKHSDERLKQNLILMPCWENVRNLFCIHLPDDFHLLGISKLNIKFGDFDDDPFQPPEADGIAIYKRSDFSFDEFCNLSEDGKDLKSLYYIENSLTKLCERFGISNEAINTIQNVADTVKKDNFEHVRIHKKTTKWHRSRKVKAATELHFKKGGIDANITITEKSGDILSCKKIIDSELWDSAWYALWKGYWADDTFIIENRSGDKIFESSGFY